MDGNVDNPEGRSARTRMLWLAVGGLLLLALGRCCDPLWNWPDYRLPPNLRVDAVLASDSENGFREGCEAAIYRLAPESIAQLNKEGIGYLNRNRPPEGDRARNPYGPWRETPGEIDLNRNGHGAARTIFGLYALGNGCNHSGRSFNYPELSRAMTRPGSFYATTANREGIIVVAPEAKLAAYFYVG